MLLKGQKQIKEEHFRLVIYRNIQKMKNRNYSTQGKKNRAAGTRFELKVRKDLEKKDWIVSKWMNNVDLEEGKIIPAKRKYNPFLRALSVGTGFPDFICFKINGKKEIIGVEVKRKGYLNPEEREKIEWYLKKRIFSRILIAKEFHNKEDKRKTSIKYIDFAEKNDK